ncbi:hypothetical protein DCAR_0522428 [Daucus carota subsp. sativus]|uniref:Uncharacterized protein n=1 Tax=Daucus carota subsp. sativus TaxID=79200 RepID=A0AAF1B3W0_DAUCS|nr:PREDICTED: uncharacterized protein LOC108223251 [Daucus carota subsp. sativus]WOH03037.1 hypothetical protein DCAR_0522428 [Daucus carota subsp. sativus]
MSAERSFEAWEEVQRHGLDLADRLTQGFTGLIQSHISPPSFSWPNPQPPKLFDVEFPSYNFVDKDFRFASDYQSGINGVLAVFDIGNKLGQAGADFGASLNGVVQQIFRFLPFPFKRNDDDVALGKLRADVTSRRQDMGVKMQVQDDLGTLAKQFRDLGFVEIDGNSDESVDENGDRYVIKSRRFGIPTEGTISVTSTYDSRKEDLESSLTARGDLWRVEASQGNSSSGNGDSSLFLLQLGPVLFVRDSTLLLPLHLSKQHMLWYGYDSKNGVHSICPAVWSKQRRWLVMSMICLNPLACSFMDFQFPNGQFTYVSGEGISTSAYLPLCGGLLQAQGRYPGDMTFSYSRKNKWGTCMTPTVQWPDKSFTLNLAQALAWKRSGLIVRPTVQFSLSPTIGGSNPGLRAELIHSFKEEVNVICGCALVTHPSAFASISVGRSKWNGNVGTSGIVLRTEVPLGSVGQPSFSIQLNSGLEF